MNTEQQTTHLIPTNQDLRMTSLEVAELTEKRHDHVMRDIQNLIEQGAIGLPNFGESSYTNSQNKEQPMYSLDFESTMVLITGYDARRRAMVVKRWLALERGEATPANDGHVSNDILINNLIGGLSSLMVDVGKLRATVENDRQITAQALSEMICFIKGHTPSRAALSLSTGNVPAFVKDACRADGDSAVKKSRLYSLYRDYCRRTETFQEGYDIFFKALYRSGLPVRPAKLTVNGVRTPMVSGLRLMEEARS